MAIKISGAPKVPLRRAASGAAEERARTMTMPAIEDNKPMVARASGKAIMAPCCSALSAMVDAIAIQAIMDPQ